MDQEEEAPPPYSAVDPMLNSRNVNHSQSPIALRAALPASRDASSSRVFDEPAVASAAPVLPTHFTSAATFFADRPPPVLDDGRGILLHHMTIYPRSQAKDFPRRPRCWASRTDEIAQQDWDTFLRYLFPPHLGLAAASNDLPRQVRAEIRRDRKDRPQETDEQRHARITAVVSEWNQCFFEPRAARIVFVYVGEPDEAPASALCPRCYPATTKATQGTQASEVSGYAGGQLPGQPNDVLPAAEQQWPLPANAWPGPPITSFSPPAMPYGAPFGTPPFAAPGALPNNQPPGYYAPPPPQFGMPPWAWNHWQAQSQCQSPGAFKGGLSGWISQLASQAQKYGERFTEQAQQYGDQLSAHAQHYSRQVEEQGLAHARWLEEQARLREQKGAFPFGGFTGRPPWERPPYEAYALTPVNNSVNDNRREMQTQNNTRSPTERTRRASVSSTSSDSSLSSIDSLSTTSDLDAADLATVRAQLQDLDDRHDRTLYDAAADLRRQLSVLQASRREARCSGRRGWKNGWRHQHHPHHHANQRNDRNDWGRWESPAQQQRNFTQRRALKEEVSATKKAFRDVLRRAREEQRELRRGRRRQQRQQSRTSGAEAVKQLGHDTPLDRRVENLDLNGQSTSPRPALEGPDSGSTSQHPQQPLLTGPPVQPDTSEQVTPTDTISSVSSTPQATAHDNSSTVGSKGQPSEAPARLKDILKSRKVKKQLQQQEQPQRQCSAAADPASPTAEEPKVSAKRPPGS